MQEQVRWVNYYLEYCEKQKNLNDKTIKAYRIDLRQFIVFLRSHGFEISTQSVRAYIMHLHGSYQVRSIKRKIASIKAWCRFLLENALIAEDPFFHCPIKIRQPILLPRTIPLRLIEAMLKEAHKATRQAATCIASRRAWRDAAVLELLFATGMRVSELCGLQAGDVDLIEKCVRVYGKGSKERMIQLENAEVLHTLLQYKQLEPTQASEPFFKNRLGHPLSDQSVRLMVRRYAAKADPQAHITPHMFRHSFATLLLEADVDIRYIQKFLGHSSISTTQIYTFVAAAKQRDILAARHPRNKFSAD
nr:tyrosine-type recombinase/integrase [uncultured Agathobaculum sp.]